MGGDSFEHLKETIPEERSATARLFVRCVALALGGAARAQGLDAGEPWEVVLFRDAAANAFALPGRKIGVNTGLLRALPSSQPDSALAAVLGHAIGHVIDGDGDARVARGLQSQGARPATGLPLGAGPYQGLILGALGAGPEYGMRWPYDPAQEAAADRIGEKLMAQAGFDPRAFATTWRELDLGADGSARAGLLVTHPLSAAREKVSAASLPEAITLYERARIAWPAPACASPTAL